MFDKYHIIRGRSGDVVPRPTFPDSLMSIVPMAGLVSDIAGLAIIQTTPFAYLEEADLEDIGFRPERVQ